MGLFDNWNRFNENKSYNLSPFDETSSGCMIPFCFVQVKFPAGYYFEAQVQGIEVSLATLKNITQVHSSVDPEDWVREVKPIMPLPFIIAVGHEWFLHWIYR